MNELAYQGYSFYQEDTPTNTIFIVSRRCIEELQPKNCYIISIDDPGNVVNIDGAHIIREGFFDSEGDETSLYPGIDPEQAMRIANFVKEIPPEQDIFIHCGAGRSRSAGVAAAIVQYQGGNPDNIFNILTPSMRCYTKVLEALTN